MSETSLAATDSRAFLRSFTLAPGRNVTMYGTAGPKVGSTTGFTARVERAFSGDGVASVGGAGAGSGDGVGGAAVGMPGSGDVVADGPGSACAVADGVSD